MSPETTVEIERKYDVDHDASLPALEDVPGTGSVDQPVEHHLQAEYFDTEDLELASRRITLRRRTGGEDAGWHLKLPVGPDERLEYQEPLRKSSTAVPKSLLKLIRVFVRDSALGPVARLDTRRTVHHIRDADGRLLADVMDDRVQAEALHPEPSTSQWREWEIELVHGPKGLLDAVEAAVTAAGARAAGHGSKLARTLGDHLPTEPAEPPVPTASGPAGDLLLAYLRKQITVLRQQDPRVRTDADGAIHQMRVATRRARSVLATYRALLDDAETVRRLREELTWLAGVLGKARDAEVMHGRLRRLLADQPAELLLGPVERRVEIELGGDYKKFHTQVVKALNGQRYFRLLDALDALVEEPALTPLAAEPADRVIPGLINRDLKRLSRAVQDAMTHRAGLADHPALHEARKGAKRLRYAAEAATPIARKKVLRIAGAAEAMQKTLGEHQDSVVMRSLLRRLGATAFQEGENGFSYGRLHGLEQAAALDAEDRFRKEWESFPTPLKTT